ncbi:MAG: hypothetical protein WC916_00255 [Candidatus Woesearchaeota archaeon]
MEEKKLQLKKNKNSSVYYTLMSIIGIFLIAIAIFNTTQIVTLNNSLTTKLAEIAENARPANLTLAIISARCTICSDITPVVSELSALKSINIVDRQEIQPDSAQAKELIRTYAINALPAIIITGEINKTSVLKTALSGALREKNGALLFDSPAPPFINLLTNKIVGSVKVTIVETVGCIACQNLSIMLFQLKKAGIYFEDVTLLDYESAKAKTLVNTYSITKLPAAILSADLEAYPSITATWSQIGTLEKDGSYIIREVPAPYYDLTKQAVAGIVNVVYLKDNLCDTCYDVEQFHSSALKGLGLYIRGSSSVDINSVQGKELVDKYAITKIPTVLLSGDVGVYAAFGKIWPQVGTVASDGTYIFRSVEIAKRPYRDLTTGEIITP